MDCSFLLGFVLVQKVFDFDELKQGLVHMVIMNFGIWEIRVEGNFVRYCRIYGVCDLINALVGC